MSLRATATERSKHTTCPGRDFQVQDHFNGPSAVGGRSWPSICSDDAVAMARPLPECGAPHAEILFEPLGYEPEVHPFERRFERDLDLSVLDLQLDQL